MPHPADPIAFSLRAARWRAKCSSLLLCMWLTGARAPPRRFLLIFVAKFICLCSENGSRPMVMQFPCASTAIRRPWTCSSSAGWFFAFFSFIHLMQMRGSLNPSVGVDFSSVSIRFQGCCAKSSGTKKIVGWKLMQFVARLTMSCRRDAPPPLAVQASWACSAPGTQCGSARVAVQLDFGCALDYSCGSLTRCSAHVLF